VPNINRLSDILFAGIFSHSVGGLFPLWIMPFDEHNFYGVQFVYVFFCCLCLWCYVHEIIAKSSVVKLFCNVFF
ncbi:hypothetical protein PS001_24570, partial [Shigella sonnei]|nr:hypothetical protein [Shigella sonnei]